MTILTLDQAEALAARTLAAIDLRLEQAYLYERATLETDLARVASDLAGLQDCGWNAGTWLPSHARRYADSLRRTAALYGVTP